MTLVLSPLRGQPLEVLELQVLGQGSQLCQAVDSTSLPVSVNTDQVDNVSTVLGATCSAALENLEADTTALAAVVSALDTSSIANVSTVAGATCTAALDTLQAAIAATGVDPGYTARFGYVNAASARIGTTFAGVVLQAASTWNTAADVPAGNTFTWDLWASTGGGCGGRAAFTGSSSTAHGAPSAGCAHRRFVCSRADVIAALPLVISVGIGGPGSAGAFRAPPDGSGNTVPTASGTAGQPTTVGTLARAFPGGEGFRDPLATPSTKVGSSGGGTVSAGTSGTNTSPILGGNPGAPVGGATGEGGAGCSVFSPGAGAASAEHGGASSTCSGTAGTNWQPGGTSAYGGSAGGWGATYNTAASASSNGALGGGLIGGSRGLSAVTAVNGSTLVAGDGGNAGDGSLSSGASGGGGGGACKAPGDAAIVNQATGGNGGDGGFPGGGAGGGGDAALGILAVPAVGSFARGGNGGTGGDGLCLLTITG